MADPGRNFFFRRAKVQKLQKVQKLATKLIKHSVKQKETMAFGGVCPPLIKFLIEPSPYDIIQCKYSPHIRYTYIN